MLFDTGISQLNKLLAMVFQNFLLNSDLVKIILESTVRAYRVCVYEIVILYIFLLLSDVVFINICVITGSFI